MSTLYPPDPVNDTPFDPRELGRQSGALTPAQIEDPRSILDAFANPRPGREYEVKFVNTTTGKLVGKISEDALFMNVWV